MHETGWVSSVIPLIQGPILERHPTVQVRQGLKIPYTYEALGYSDGADPTSNSQAYQTDLSLIDVSETSTWKPRVIIECKFEKITTHDAITYSDKATAHKNVHPYLRYGFFIGRRSHFPLPGRLFRHGGSFDFMISWVEATPTDIELDALIRVLVDEIAASKALEEMMFSSRSPLREKYYVLHRPLILAKSGDRLRSA